MNLMKATGEVEINLQEGGEEFKCYMIWQIMVANVALKWAAENTEGWNSRV